MPRASFIDFSYESSALFETPLTALALCENVQETQSGGHELPEGSGYRPTSFKSGVQAKVAALEGTATLVLRNSLEQLALQKPPRHPQCA